MDGTTTPTATTVEKLYPRLPSNQVAGQVQMGLLCLQRQAGRCRSALGVFTCHAFHGPFRHSMVVAKL